MFFVRNLSSFATVRKGSICIGARGSGVALNIFCAAVTAAAQLDWLRHRGGWYNEETADIWGIDGVCKHREQTECWGRWEARELRRSEGALVDRLAIEGVAQGQPPQGLCFYINGDGG